MGTLHYGWEAGWLLVAAGTGSRAVVHLPALCLRHGALPLLLPVLATVALLVAPLQYAWAVLGQHSGLSCVAVWACVPVLQGVLSMDRGQASAGWP